MNSTESSSPPLEFDRHHGLLCVIAITYVLFFVMGLYFNVVILKALQEVRNRNTIVNQLIVFQALLGLLLSTTSFPLIALVLFSDLQLEYLRQVCVTQNVLATYCIIAIYSSIATIAIVRYLYVFHSSLMNKFSERVMSSILCVLCSLAPLGAAQQHLPPRTPRHVSFCTGDLDSIEQEDFWKDTWPPNMVIVLLGLLYVRIYVELQSIEKRRVLKLTHRVAITANNVQTVQRRKRINVVGAKASALTVVLCEISVASVQSLNLADRDQLATWGLPVYWALCLFAMSLAFTPALLYCLSNDEIRAQLVQCWIPAWLRKHAAATTIPRNTVTTTAVSRV